MPFGLKKYFDANPTIADVLYDTVTGKYHAVGNNGYYLISDDGSVWQIRYLPIYSTTALTVLKKFSNGSFFVTGASGKMWNSADGGYSYTSVSSPSTVQFNDIIEGVGTAVSLPYGFTSLLLHCDGTNTSQIFTDSSGRNVTLTANGNVQNSTADKVFGTGSAYFDGAGDYLTAPDNAAWDFSGPFCVECWYKATGNTNTYQGIVTNWKWSFGTNTGWRIGVQPGNGKFSFGANDGSLWNGIPFQLNGTTTVAMNTWYHVAVTRDSSNVVRLFVNGVQEASGTMSFNPINTQNDPLRIGCENTDGEGRNPVFGYIDELRIIKNEAVYTSNFTVPTSELSTVSTNLSLNVNYVVCGASGITAVSADSNAWTTTGSNSTTTNSLVSVATNGSIYVFVGAAGTIITTTDFATWTLRTSGTASQFNKISWGGDRFVAVGASGIVSYSLDGITWVTTTLSASGLGNVALYDVIYKNFQFIACGDSGYVVSSTNGNKWVLSSVTNSSFSFRSIAPAAGRSLYFAGNGSVSRTT